MMMRTIGMASDHAGFELKEFLKPYLKSMRYEILDFGTHSTGSMDYPDTAHPLAEAIESGKVECGIAICGSGNGIAMTLNKHQGVRAALCWTPELGALARQHNDANVLRFRQDLSRRSCPEIVKSFLSSEFKVEDTGAG